MEDTRRLRDILLDQCEAREIRMEELVKKTGIPEQYLDAIINDVRTRLPAFPYIRIYLIRLAELLGLPKDMLIAKYRAEFSDKISGSDDRLPGNRFSLPSGRRRYLIGGVIVAVVLIVYLVSRSDFFGTPHLSIAVPDSGEEPFMVTTTSTIMLAGQVDSGDKLVINGQEVPTQEDGSFIKEYQLVPEINIIEFTARRFLGRSFTITRQVYYEEAPAASATKTQPKKADVLDGDGSATTSVPLEPESR